MRPSSDARLTGQPEAWVVKAGVHGSCMAADRGNAEYALYGELFQPGFPSVGGGMISATQRAPRIPIRRRLRSFVAPYVEPPLREFPHPSIFDANGFVAHDARRTCTVG